MSDNYICYTFKYLITFIRLEPRLQSILDSLYGTFWWRSCIRL